MQDLNRIWKHTAPTAHTMVITAGISITRGWQVDLVFYKPVPCGSSIWDGLGVSQVLFKIHDNVDVGVAIVQPKRHFMPVPIDTSH